MREKLGKSHRRKRKTGQGGKHRIIAAAALVPAVTALIAAAVFLIYVSVYYRADAAAEEALRTDEVLVEKTDYGWYFDGPSEETALIFYPGGKVEETAYAPLLHSLAAAGMDVCLAKMPFRLAVLDTDAAKDIIEQYSYEKWYIGGHSLGGVMAADFAAGHGGLFEGVILLAAYPVKEIPSQLSELLLVGSRDQVIDMDKVAEGRQYAPENYEEDVIEGGNHAQFGSYGRQKGDGIPSITPQQQRHETIDRIMDFVNKSSNQTEVLNWHF